MPDPLEILATPIAPVDPDAAFASRLRERVRRSLDLPEGVTVSGLSNVAPREAGAGRSGEPSKPEPSDESSKRGDVSYASWWTPDADRAAAFYAAVLGWQYSTPRPNGDRLVTNVPRPLGLVGTWTHSSTLFCCYLVDDLDTAVDAVRATGGTSAGPTDADYGRIADGTDPLGKRFALAQAGPDGQRPDGAAAAGDLVYLTFETPDSQTTRCFYSAVLGWTFVPGRVEDGWACGNAYPMTGIAGGRPDQLIVPMWSTEDIDRAVSQVRTAGGLVLADPARQPYGVSAECADDQGGRFYLLGS